MDPNQQDQSLPTLPTVPPIPSQPTEIQQITPPQLTPISATQNTNPISPPKKSFFSHKIIIILLLAIILFSSCAGGYFYLIYRPAKLDKEYIQGNEQTLPKLTAEITRLKKEDFLTVKNIKLNYDDAKKALLQHQTNANSTKLKVSALKKDYDTLKPTTRTKKLQELSTNQFKIAEDIIKGYGDSLEYRQKIFDADGDKLDPASETFTSSHYRDGGRADLIIQT